MPWAKRKSGNMEYYKKGKDFRSLTKVDLIELSQSLFHNPSGEPKDWKFFSFLDKQTTKGFPSMSSAYCYVKKAKRCH